MEDRDARGGGDLDAVEASVAALCSRADLRSLSDAAAVDRLRRIEALQGMLYSASVRAIADIDERSQPASRA